MTNECGVFSEDTMVITADFTRKPMKDLKVGDQIIGDDSTLRTVLSITKADDVMYKLHPRKAQEIICNGNALCLQCNDYRSVSWDKQWERYRVSYIDENHKSTNTSFYVNKHNDSKEDTYDAANEFKNSLSNMRNQLIQISLQDYLTQSKNWRKQYCLYNAPINFEYHPIFIDPYILGYWLGDGTSKQPEITTENPEVVSYFDNYAKSIHHQLNQSKQAKGNAHSYYLSSFTGGMGDNKFKNNLRKYNLLNNKHIPNEYKYNSREVQLKLLAGIIDSDGFCDDGTSYDICLKLENLIDDIQFVCQCLGYKTIKKKRNGTCTNSRNGRVTGIYYRLRVKSEDFSDIPLLLNYKKARPKELDGSRYNFKMEKLEQATNGIKLELDGNGRFLLDNFIVTHC